MEIMDPFAHELLARPPPPAFDFDFFPAAGNVDTMTMNTEFAIGQLDDYLRAIGVLPPLPAPVYVPPAAAVWGDMDYGVGVHLPATHDLYFDAQVTQPAAPPPSPAASSYDDGSAATLGSYASDIDASLRAMEADAAYRTSPDYLDDGRVDPAARAALVSWMFDFARYFGFGPAAVHRAVSYADRFLSVSAAAATGVGADDADHRQLRLLGAAAVYAAAKYEDGATARRVSAGDIAACCGFAAAREVLDAERALLAALGYRLAGPTAHTFVEHFTGRAGRRGEEGEEALRRAAHLIADSSLLDHRCLGLLPSAVAAAAILLARLFLEAPSSHGREQVRRWGRELEELTGYKPMDVYDGLECLYKRMPDDPGFEISPSLFADQS